MLKSRQFVAEAEMSSSHIVLIVLDTNVLVSAFLKRKSHPGQILDMILAGSVRIATDGRIFEEYRNVLKRPKLRIDPSKVDAVLSFLSVTSQRVSPVRLTLVGTKIMDHSDLPFAEVAVAAGADALVTGNARHFNFLDGSNIAVLTPADFLRKIA
jgi:putative PIN family toxin of toxin-antitoxin system